MGTLRVCLVISTIIIFGVTFVVISGHGVIWPKFFISDLLAANWRSQFNTDLVIHLALVGLWVAWREGFGVKGFVFGIFCVVWGGMFTFPYVLITTYKAKANFSDIFLGVHSSRTAS
ncbi:MAG: hypothetical protein ACU84Q_06450 [Gammaproteobacteria bacterium]